MGKAIITLIDTDSNDISMSSEFDPELNMDDPTPAQFVAMEMMLAITKKFKSMNEDAEEA